MEKGPFFSTQDRYLFEPYENAMFFWDHRDETVSMKFIGQEFCTMVPQDHRIFNDAIISGQEITKAEFEAGKIDDQSAPT